MSGSAGTQVMYRHTTIEVMRKGLVDRGKGNADIKVSSTMVATLYIGNRISKKRDQAGKHIMHMEYLNSKQSHPHHHQSVQLSSNQAQPASSASPLPHSRPA